MMILLSDGEVSNRNLRLWVASDKEETEVGITVNCFLTNLNHLGNGIKTPVPMYHMMKKLSDDLYCMLQRFEKHTNVICSC